MNRTEQENDSAITETAIKLKEEMQEWGLIVNKALVENNLSIIKEDLRQILEKGSKFYKTIDSSIKKIQDKNDTILLIENEYSIRQLLSLEISRLCTMFEKKSIALSYDIDGSVPQMLFGDYEHILEIIYRFLRESAGRIQKGRIRIELSCKDVSYSTALLIKYIDLTQGFAEEDLDALQMFIATSDETYLRKASPKVYSYRMIYRIIQFMYGQLDMKIINGNQIEFLVSVPQLEVEVEELGS